MGRLFFLVIMLFSMPLLAMDSDDALPEKDDDTTFSLVTHKQNFIILYGYDFKEQPDGRDPEEVNFQISLKKKILNKIDHLNVQLYFGYTQKSFWQIYNHSNSRPFRETNYNPELYFNIDLVPELRQYGLTNVYAGYEHESNGRDLPASRSWDRFYAQLFFKYDNWSGSLKGWKRIPEPDKTDPTDVDGDDNPEIVKIYGSGELRVDYDYYAHRFGFFGRKNAVGLDVSIPFGRKAYVFVRYFSGFGESLIDYDRHVNRLGVGIQLSR